MPSAPMLPIDPPPPSVRIACGGCCRSIEIPRPPGVDQIVTPPDGWGEVMVAYQAQEGGHIRQTSVWCCSELCATRWVTQHAKDETDRLRVASAPWLSIVFLPPGVLG